MKESVNERENGNATALIDGDDQHRPHQVSFQDRIELKIPLRQYVFNNFVSLSGRNRFVKKDNEPPLRLLDDLFRKTKTTPCIYWLPLTPEQVSATWT